MWADDRDETIARRLRHRWLVMGASLGGAAVAGAAIAGAIGSRLLFALAALAALSPACVVIVAGARLREAASATERDLADLHRKIAQAEHAREQAELSYRERLHDARSAVAGVMGGISVLSRASEPYAEGRRLQHLVAVELERLQSLLDADAGRPPAAAPDAQPTIRPLAG